MEAALILVSAVAALEALGLLYLALRLAHTSASDNRALMETHARSVAMVLAQADEHVKAAWTQGAQAVSRLIAAKHPASHATFRQNTGTIDGAQYATKQHFLGFKEDQGIPHEEREAAARRQIERESDLAEQQAQHRLRPATQLAFEDDIPTINGTPR